MSCTGCEMDGIYAMYPIGTTGLTSVWEPTIGGLGSEVDPSPLYVYRFPLEYELPGWGLKRNATFNVSQNPGGTHTEGHGVNERAKKLAEKAARPPDEQEDYLDPFGWRFAPDNPDQLGPGDPTMVYIIPLYFGHTPSDGSCSAATPAPPRDFCTGGTPCFTSILYTFEIHSVILADSPPSQYPNPASPSAFAPTDPNEVTSNVTTNIQSGLGRYESTHDPRGVANPAGQTSYVTTQILELNVKIAPDDCGSWGVWETNFSDWNVAIPDYTHTSADTNDVPDERMAFGVFCEPCMPLTPPDGGGDENPGSQGGGKNFNQSSI